MPLTVCDRKTVDTRNLVAVDFIKQGEHTLGEDMVVQYNKSQQFYYLSKQQPWEPLLLHMGSLSPGSPQSTIYGQSHIRTISRLFIRIVGVPHTAFALPDNGLQKPRESIEVRGLVII